MRSSTWPAVAVLIVVVALVATAAVLMNRPERPTGSSSTLPPLAEPQPPSDDPSQQPDYSRFYEQQLTWTPCRVDAECARLVVPLDWTKPQGETIELALARIPAESPDERIGSLVLNPGGPGGSGVQYVGNFGRNVTTADVRARYDIAGFDPRGVGESHPIDCLPDLQMDDYLAFDGEPQSAEGREAMRAQAARFAAGCARSAGELLGHVDTLSAAKDMDVLRAALGDDRLSYLGKSYGTLLGATYADTFPHRVGRMVLDGALDPASDNEDLLVGQAVGMEQALREYGTDCLDDGRRCPLSGTVDEAVQQVRDLIAQVEEKPLATGDADRPLTAPLAVTGIITPLYDDASWPVLSSALGAAFEGDGGELLTLADRYADRRPDGSYSSNLLEAFAAVNCLDYPMDDDLAAMQTVERRALEASPTFGSYLAYGEITCGEWPVEAVRTPAPLDAEGAPPILVVGTTGDPATPFAWSQSLAEQLDSGHLLVWEGEGHTAYTRGSQCVDGAVDRYLLDGEIPADGATCGS